MATLHPAVSVAASSLFSLCCPRNSSHVWFMLLFVPCWVLLSLSESFLIFGLLTLMERAEFFLNGSAETFLRSSSFSQSPVLDIVSVTFASIEFLLPFCHPVTQRCIYLFRKNENTFHLKQKTNLLYTEVSTNVLWKIVWQVKMEAAPQLYSCTFTSNCSVQLWNVTQRTCCRLTERPEKSFAPGFSLCQNLGILILQMRESLTDRPWDSDGWSPVGTDRVQVV